jgi:hypothetical protein
MAEGNRKEPGLLQQAGNMLGAAYRAVMRGGEIQAAGRQGIDELGQALKAFPDSIQAHAEPGSMFEPLHRDIAAARDKYAPEQPLPSPSQILKEGKATDTVHGPAQQAEKPHAMTPSGIVKEGKPDGTVHGPDRQGDRPHTPSPSEISKDRGEKPWADYVTERREKGNQDGNAGNDQNERGQGRSLADEQKERGRDR